MGLLGRQDDDPGDTRPVLGRFKYRDSTGLIGRTRLQADVTLMDITMEYRDQLPEEFLTILELLVNPQTGFYIGVIEQQFAHECDHPLITSPPSSNHGLCPVDSRPSISAK